MVATWFSASTWLDCFVIKGEDEKCVLTKGGRLKTQRSQAGHKKQKIEKSYKKWALFESEIVLLYARLDIVMSKIYHIYTIYKGYVLVPSIYTTGRRPYSKRKISFLNPRLPWIKGQIQPILYIHRSLWTYSITIMVSLNIISRESQAYPMLRRNKHSILRRQTLPGRRSVLATIHSRNIQRTITSMARSAINVVQGDMAPVDALIVVRGPAGLAG